MSSDAPPGLRLLGANLPRSCSIGPSIILRDAGRLTGSTTFRARRDRSFLEQSGSLASLTEGSQSPLRVRIQLPPPASLQFSGFSSSLREKRAFGRNPAPQVHRRTGLVGFKREFWRFLSVCTLGVDLSCRWIWRLTLNKRRAVAGPLFIGAGSDRLRKSEGSLLRRPTHWNIKTAGP